MQNAVTPVLTEAILARLLIGARLAGQQVEEPVSRTQGDIITYLNEHFTEPITLEALAERFFISKNYLNRVFRKATGTTVMDYLIRKRVTYVQQLLINGIPATQAAALAGFGDYTCFYRAYVKRFGHAPSLDRGQTKPRLNFQNFLRELSGSGAVEDETEQERFLREQEELMQSASEDIVKSRSYHSGDPSQLEET